MTPSEAGQTLDFDEDIKPLFRPRDHGAMSFAFDLWSEADVKQHATAILARLQAGTMPCDGAWSSETIELFQRWAAQQTES
jgi:hypothetical protein